MFCNVLAGAHFFIVLGQANLQVSQAFIFLPFDSYLQVDKLTAAIARAFVQANLFGEVTLLFRTYTFSDWIMLNLFNLSLWL